MPKDVPITFVCTTKFLRDTLCKNLEQLENTDWLGMSNKYALTSLVNTLRQRCAPTAFRMANSPNDTKLINLGRRGAQQLARERGAQLVIPNLDPTLELTGARLSTLTQRVAYRLIRNRRNTPERRSTVKTVQSVLLSIKEDVNEYATTQDVWLSLRTKDIRLPIRDFLWKSLHNAFRCGSFWENIPNYEDRAMCQYCGTTESMSHILVECNAPGQDEIWQMAGKLWSRKQALWEKPNLDEILGSNLRRWLSVKKKRRLFVERLWRILISEAAYMIWCLRCERSIEHADDDNWTHSTAAIKARWECTINRRLHLDIAMTHRRFGRLALDRNLVIGTWHGTINDEIALPDDWTVIKRVLVGIDPQIFDLEARG
ncbi:uncharacterized protein C8Q71DRAFT_703029 [Rhodofomes roseus]|uniref:Reverse transcriptase zinc-binding domain-containing protein n=1 Tax=Rhodofomes roseus TaxID=34475 RepID=A0ABQ8KP92_9APHY|nr:uncharacterized protein C8Q71DRAFT_703029 [Rhodofomes roseus]KAH9839780.1 hypothetical protein C8Q71DRAFT_703029 [Rhodofomes roseus]